MRRIYRSFRSFDRPSQVLMVNQFTINLGFYMLMPYLAAYLAGPLEPSTRHTVVDPDLLRARIAEVRERGWSVNPEGLSDGIAAVGANLAMRRMGDPAEVADMCLVLASPLARWMTGTNVEVHGGGEGPAYLDSSTGEVSRP